MPGSTVHVANFPPPEVPPGIARRAISPEMREHFNRFVEGHTSDENTRGLIREFLANERPDLALGVLLIAVLGLRPTYA